MVLVAEDICFQEKPSSSGISESYEPGPEELLEGLVCGETAENQSEHVSEPGCRPLGGLLGVVGFYFQEGQEDAAHRSQTQ